VSFVVVFARRAVRGGDTVRATECWKPNSAEHGESGACPPEET
jgi:hypothetical protein